jgi:hypothetical protein
MTLNAFSTVLELLTSPVVVFSGGWQHRQLLAYKLLDAVYMIGLRIGEEMSRSILTDLCSDLFAAFDKGSILWTSILAQNVFGQFFSPQIQFNPNILPKLNITKLIQLLALFYGTKK